MNTLTTSNINDLTAAEAAFAGGFIGTFFVMGLIICVLLIVAMWRLFEKAGEKGWKSLIPIYDMYILYKIAGSKAIFWASLCISIICSITTATNALPIDYTASQEVITEQLNALDWNNYIPFIAAAVISIITSIVFYVIVAHRLAKAFGKGIGYTLGIIFVPEIVLLVLGFGKAKYSVKNLDK